MKHLRAALAGGTLSFALIGGPIAARAESPAPIAPAVAAKLDAIVRAHAGSAQGSAAAVSVAIVENGKIVYARAGGMEDVAAKRAATTRTRFRIASVTKTFTAVCVLQLVERGKLALDAPLSGVLPDAPHAREITIRQLLMHTAGLPNYGDAAFNDGRVKTKTTPAAILASVGSQPLDFTPGSRYAYSNTGYVVLGLAVEKVAGTSLAAYEKTHIFNPAGMRDTTAGAFGGGPGYATPYMDEAATPAMPYDASWLYADGDITSTPTDVARFDIALMNGVLLKPQTFAAMRANPVATDEPSARYGLGVMLFPFADLTFVGHHGGVPGFETDNEMLPEAKFAVVTFGNAFDFSTAALNGPLLATLFPQASARAVAQRKAEALTAAPGEDAALTERFRIFFAALQNGRVDRGTVTDEMNAQLSAEMLGTVASRLGTLGTLQKLIYRGKVDQGKGTVYHYTGVFSAQTTPITFSLDKNDKIAGAVLQ